jgi:probable rRNA maturation factor
MTTPANATPVDLSLELDIAPQFEEDVDSELLQNVLTNVLTANRVSGPVELSMVITDDAELHELNLQYRGIDAPTDVLSFSQAEASVGHAADDFPASGDMARPLGDVIISGDRVRSQAAEFGHGRRRELAYLAVHGLLHVLGYDHENDIDRQTMRLAEEAALESVPR